MSDVKLGLEATLKIDTVEMKEIRDLTISFEKAEADGTTRANNGWRATVGTLKDASLEFKVLNKADSTEFSTFYTKFLSGDPVLAEVSDVGATLLLDCEVMGFSVNQELEEVISADVTLKPTVKASGTGINNAVPE